MVGFATGSSRHAMTCADVYHRFTAVPSRLAGERLGIRIFYGRFPTFNFMRRLLCIFLMVFLPLHSFAMQGGWYSAGSAFDIAHEIDHLAGASHHHDDVHASVHYDDSNASDKHFAEHSAAQPCAALPTIITHSLAIDPFTFAMNDPGHYISDPIPERLQRPPKSLG
jgi:hypothetical protein